MTKKLLIITYYWPPASGAGVQRWLKFSKYLPEFGWEPIILTVDPGYAAYPSHDTSLSKDIPAGARIYRTKATDYFSIYKKSRSAVPSAGFATGNENSMKSKIMRFVRGNFFIPDPRKGWNKFAFKKACELIENEDIKYVITTSPPHSTQLIGYNLKKKFPRIKWIADLRDPWTDIYYYRMFYHTFFAREIDKYLEKKVLVTADRIITVGESLKNLFLKKMPQNDKIDVITNGYDEEDFKNRKPESPERFTISYIGTLSDAYPVDGLADALYDLKANGSDIILKFIGYVSQTQRELLLRKSGISTIRFFPYVNHEEAVRYLSESTLLLLIIPDHHSNKTILTGKLFEYLASGKPILCLGPEDGDAAEILKRTGHGRCAGYSDVEQIKNIILQYLKEPANKPAPVEFTRKALTAKLDQVLSGL